MILPRIYGFSTLGRLPDLFLFAATFILATSFFGQAAGDMVQAARNRRGSLRRDHLAAVLPGRPVLAGGGDPAGHAPDRAGLPLRSAIDGMVRINQMGASLGEVSKDWISLLALGLAYYLLAVLGSGLRRRRLAYAG